MSENESLAERLRALEKEVADIKRRLEPAQTTEKWLDEVCGSMKRFPEFDEVVRLGQELRRAQRDPGA